MNSPTQISQPRRSRRGITLVEVMIAATICTLVIAGTISSMLLIARTYAAAERGVDVSLEENATASRFEDDLRGISSVTEASDTSLSFVTTNRHDQTSRIKIEFTVPEGEETGSSPGCGWSLVRLQLPEPSERGC